MIRTKKEPAKVITPEEKISELENEIDVLQNETDDTPASLERVEHCRKEIEIQKNAIRDRKEPAPGPTEQKPA